MRRIVLMLIIIGLFTGHTLPGGEKSPVSDAWRLYLQTPEGRPAADVDVWLVGKTFALHARTDEHGRVAFSDVAGAYRIIAIDRARNWVLHMGEIRVRPGETRRLRMGVGGILRGRVVAIGTDRGLADMQVTVMQTLVLRKMDREVLIDSPELRMLLRPTVRTDADGRFEVRGLIPGLVLVTAVGPRNVALGREAGIRSGEVQEVVLEAIRGGASLILHVTDTQGKPIRNARVYLDRRTSGRRSPFWRMFDERAFYTDARGYVRIDGIPAGQRFVVNIIARPRISWRTESIELAEGEEREWAIELPEGNVVVGIAVDEDGEPVQSLDPVRRVYRPKRFSAGSLEVAKWDPPDEQGRFAIYGLPKGRFRIELRAPGYVPVSTDVELTGYGERYDLGRVVFQKGERIRGRVVTRDGRPVSSVKVEASPSGFFTIIYGPNPQATTDEEGRFTIMGLMRGSDYSLHVSGGYVNTERVVVPAGTDNVQIQVIQAGILRGRVVTPDGTPVPAYRLDGILEVVRGSAHSVRGLFRTVANPAGVFEIGDLPPGTARFNVIAPGYASRRIRAEVRAGEVTDLGDIVVEAACEIVLKARTPERAPVVQATVAILPSPEDWLFEPYAEGVTDGTGTVRFKNIPRGEFYVEWSHPDYATTRGKLVIGEDCTATPSEWTLEVGGRLRICVEDAQGRPLANERIYLSPVKGSLPFAGSLLTGKDGCVLTEQLKPGEYRVEVRRVTPGEHSQFMRFRQIAEVQAGVTREVRISICAFEIRASFWIGQTPITLGEVYFSSGGAIPSAATTQVVRLKGQPEFTLCLNRTDEISLFVRSGQQEWRLAIPLTDAKTPQSDVWTVTRTDRGYRVDIRLPDTRSFVTVTDARSGEPIADANVSFSQDDVSVHCVTDVRGGCTLRGFLNRSGTLSVYHQAYVTYSHEAVAGLQSTITVQLEKGGRIYGRLLDPNGRPATGMVVVRAGRTSRGAVARETFKVRGVPLDRTVTLIGRDFLRKYAPAVTEVRMDTEDQQVDLQLQEPAVLEVQVVDASEQPIQGVKVEVLLPNGTDIAWYCRSVWEEARTDAQGQVVLDRVPPGELTVRAVVGEKTGQVRVVVIPGQTYRVVLKVK